MNTRLGLGLYPAVGCGVCLPLVVEAKHTLKPNTFPQVTLFAKLGRLYLIGPLLPSVCANALYEMGSQP